MVQIIADSTCDLSEELLERYGVELVPLHIVLGDKEYRDGKEITPDAIYEWSDANRTTPKTSAVSIEDAMEVMNPHLQKGEELVMFSISEQMSTTGNVFRLAAQELDAQDRVSVVDSASLSTGIGLLVIEAAVMAAQGEERQAIVARMEAWKAQVRASFVVDTLEYLYRGGRCSGLAALAGSVLKLHPQILVQDGAMCVGKKYRGKLESVILKYVREMEPQLLAARPERVFITHSGCPEEIVQAVREYLLGLGYFEEVLTTRAGGVISSHCGPGTLGVLYIHRS